MSHPYHTLGETTSCSWIKPDQEGLVPDYYFYHCWIETNLFGEYSLFRSWGSKGKGVTGRMVMLCETLAEAQTEIAKIDKIRHRRGYGRREELDKEKGYLSPKLIKTRPPAPVTPPENEYISLPLFAV